MSNKIIGYQSHMFFYVDKGAFEDAYNAFVDKWNGDTYGSEDFWATNDETGEIEGFQSNIIYYLNGVEERKAFKKEYDAFVKEWDGDKQGSEDFWATDDDEEYNGEEPILGESTKTYEVLLTENEYRKVRSILNEGKNDVVGRLWLPNGYSDIDFAMTWRDYKNDFKAKVVRTDEGKYEIVGKLSDVNKVCDFLYDSNPNFKVFYP